MEARREINDFFTISRSKKGQIEITYDYIENIPNIWALLQRFGFDTMKLNNKRILFQKEEGGYKIIPMRQLYVLNDAFRKFIIDSLENNLLSIPNDVTRSEILDWCKGLHRTWKDPIRGRDFDFLDKRRENPRFPYETSYDEDDIHMIRLKMSRRYQDAFNNYKYRFGIQYLITALEEWGFSKSVDSVGTYSKNSPFYYKKIKDNTFLVFIHWNHESKRNNDGVGLWEATYSQEKHIGLIEPIHAHAIKLNFRFEWGDFKYMNEFIETPPSRDCEIKALKKCRELSATAISRFRFIEYSHHNALINLWERAVTQPLFPNIEISLHILKRWQPE